MTLIKLVEEVESKKKAYREAFTASSNAFDRFVKMNLSLATLTSKEIRTSLEEWRLARAAEVEAEQAWLNAHNRASAEIQAGRNKLMR
jgi:uridine phosphorylase